MFSNPLHAGAKGHRVAAVTIDHCHPFGTATERRQEWNWMPDARFTLTPARLGPIFGCQKRKEHRVNK
ncbi:MAG: hypothetical protein ACREP3_13790 [Candidatus Binatia bacterium]